MISSRILVFFYYVIMSEHRLCFLKTYLRQVVTSKLYKWKIIYFGKMPLITFITNEILNTRFNNCHCYWDERGYQYFRELLKLHKSFAFQYKIWVTWFKSFLIWKWIKAHIDLHLTRTPLIGIDAIKGYWKITTILSLYWQMRRSAK